jgi:PAB1-binding protein PBP1
VRSLSKLPAKFAACDHAVDVERPTCANDMWNWTPYLPSPASQMPNPNVMCTVGSTSDDVGQ